MLKLFLKTTVRNLWKNKGYSFLNIFGLAIGIACAALIFLWVEDELNFDKNNAKRGQLYQVEVNMSFGGNSFTIGSTPRAMGAAIKAEIPGIARAARYSDGDQRFTFSTDNQPLYATGRYTDAALFNMFSFDFLQGDAKTPFPQLYSVVLTQSAVKKIFDEEKMVIGKTVRVDNKHDYVVSGVVKDMPANSTLQFEWLAPYDITLQERKQLNPDDNDAVSWDSYGPLTFVELEKNANLATVNNNLKGFIHGKAVSQKSEAFVFPMKDWRLYADFANGEPTGGGRIQQVRMLAAIAWVILLIACINFMNLATASSQKRSREVGVRKVMGAGKKGLVTQFISEAFLMSFIATVLAILITSISLPSFSQLMQKQLSLNLINPVHIISLLLITVICGVIAGSYPAFYLASFKPVLVLKGLKAKAGKAAFVRKGLVVLQFAVSVIFIISTIIVYQQIQHVKNRQLGFNKERLIEINPQQDVSKYSRSLKMNC